MLPSDAVDWRDSWFWDSLTLRASGRQKQNQTHQSKRRGKDLCNTVKCMEGGRRPLKFVSVCERTFRQSSELWTLKLRPAATAASYCHTFNPAVPVVISRHRSVWREYLRHRRVPGIAVSYLCLSRSCICRQGVSVNEMCLSQIRLCGFVCVCARVRLRVCWCAYGQGR